MENNGLDNIKNSETTGYQVGAVIYDRTANSSQSIPKMLIYKKAESKIRSSNQQSKIFSKKQGNHKETLAFNSHFESGNLLKVHRIAENEYVLLLSSDTENPDYTIWFFFEVTSFAHEGPVRFHIINITRDQPLMQEGMRPIIFDKGLWFPGGENIEFIETYKFRNYLVDHSKCFTLSFTYTMRSNSSIKIAYTYPYTLSTLNRFCTKIKKYTKLVRVNFLTKTLAGVDCNYVIITADADTYNLKLPGAHSGKRAVFLTGRVHPGETQSSYMLEGVIKYLLSDEAKLLRKYLVFFIIPMLNPDGVILGNYRSSRLGLDLNRKWINPSPNQHPTIFSAKELLKSINTVHSIALTCDFHGHSKQKNAFLYGCSKNKSNTILLLMSQLSRTFSLPQCSFRMEKHKEGTARISIFKEFHVFNSFTMECSIFGSASAQFSTKDIKKLGENFVKTFSLFLPDKKSSRKTTKFCNVTSRVYLENRRSEPVETRSKEKQIHLPYIITKVQPEFFRTTDNEQSAKNLIVLTTPSMHRANDEKKVESDSLPLVNNKQIKYVTRKLCSIRKEVVEFKRQSECSFNDSSTTKLPYIVSTPFRLLHSKS